MIKPGGWTIVDKMSAWRDHLNTLKSRSNREHLEKKKSQIISVKRNWKLKSINRSWCFDNYRFQISLNFHIVTIFLREKIKQQLGTRITSYYCEQEGKKRGKLFTWVSMATRVYWGTSRKRRVAPFFTSSKAVWESIEEIWRWSRKVLQNAWKLVPSSSGLFWYRC